MKAVNYCVVSGIFFALVCLLHLARIAGDYSVQVDEYAVPMAASWIAAIATALLAFWAFHIARTSGDGHG
ncbi:MAG: hypothetical protein OEM60_10305 [Gammaproteobacteria bacterium]|nr:hypothetical protein [Gammaproteobacteria bacterium]MDH3431942.1 hypothetical protein [Gammaproteobacteria bacterium]MDH3434242.1 hypothetical protein [Gammaproteobacteria bacterium]